MPTRVPDILAKIVATRRSRLAGGGEEAPSNVRGVLDLPSDPDRFPQAVRNANGTAVIAEVKMGSPKLGSLAGKIDPELQARTYAENGATALSVVVEPDHFFGSYELLARCKRASGLPTLAKDFVVDPIQLQWAHRAGADAVLLIAALYEPEDLELLVRSAHDLGLAVLLETHDPRDLRLATSTEVGIVGVNNRDLRTFEVSLERSIEMVKSLPAAALKVAESGIDSHDAVVRLERAGFDAFLVGEALLLAEDVGAKLRELLGASAG